MSNSDKNATELLSRARNAALKAKKRSKIKRMMRERAYDSCVASELHYVDRLTMRDLRMLQMSND